MVETWDLSDRPVDMLVGFSHLKVGSAVAGYFLAKGWQRLGIATGDDHRASMRREGFVVDRGPRGADRAWCPRRATWRWAARALGELLQQDPDVCRPSSAARTSWRRACWSRPRRAACGCPQDLAVCGFGDADFAAHIRAVA